MPGNNDTPTTGIGIAEAAAQFETMLDAEEATPDDEDREDADETGEADDRETDDDADETAVDESEEDEVESDDDADDESEDDEKAKPEEEFEIDLGRGQKVKVTKDELVKGYLRQSDYTRKTQEVAETRKALQAESSEVLRERAQYATLLTALEQQIQLTEVPAEPDWDRLYAQDPIQASRAERQWRKEVEARREKLDAIRAEKARVEQANAQREQAEFRQFVAEQREVLVTELLPSWRDPKVERREKAEVVEYALQSGLSPDEVRTLADARAVALLYKAMKYDKAMQRKAEASKAGAKSAAASPTLKPGSAAAKPAPAVEMKKQFDRLKKTGSIDDAAQYILKTLR